MKFYAKYINKNVKKGIQIFYFVNIVTADDINHTLQGYRKQNLINNNHTQCCHLL